MTMILDQRRDEILQVIEQQGFVSLQELVTRLGASESTVRIKCDDKDTVLGSLRGAVSILLKAAGGGGGGSGH